MNATYHSTPFKHKVISIHCLISRVGITLTHQALSNGIGVKRLRSEKSIQKKGAGKND
jgi:hypothetical protein